MVIIRVGGDRDKLAVLGYFNRIDTSSKVINVPLQIFCDKY